MPSIPWALILPTFASLPWVISTLIVTTSCVLGTSFLVPPFSFSNFSDKSFGSFLKCLLEKLQCSVLLLAQFDLSITISTRRQSFLHHLLPLVPWLSIQKHYFPFGLTISLFNLLTTLFSFLSSLYYLASFPSLLASWWPSWPFYLPLSFVIPIPLLLLLIIFFWDIRDVIPSA